MNKPIKKMLFIAAVALSCWLAWQVLFSVCWSPLSTQCNQLIAEINDEDALLDRRISAISKVVELNESGSADLLAAVLERDCHSELSLPLLEALDKMNDPSVLPRLERIFSQNEFGKGDMVYIQLMNKLSQKSLYYQIRRFITKF